MEEYVLTQEEKSDLAYYLETYWMFEEAEAIKCVENLARMYKDYPQLYTKNNHMHNDFCYWFFHQRRARRANMSTKRMRANYEAHLNRCRCDVCESRG